MTSNSSSSPNRGSGGAPSTTVLTSTGVIEKDAACVQGPDFSSLISLSHEEALRTILHHYNTTGLQATQIGRARDLLRSMFTRRAKEGREKQKIFLSYTSNLISCGLRETFVYLAKERLVDGFVATAGGIEEDVIKCLGPTLMGNFALKGTALRRDGLNRIGNLLVPNDNYCHFEDFFMPLLKRLHEDQRACRWSDHTAPSQIISRMAKALAESHPDLCEESLVYWCDRHDIPMFCPAFTDGSMGDMIYFYNFSKKGLVVDPARDVARLRSLLVCRSLSETAPSSTTGGTGGSSKDPPRYHTDGDTGSPPSHTEERAQFTSTPAAHAVPRRVGAVVLGGGLPKHHLLHNIPMDDVVMVTTGVEADGSTSAGTLRDDRSAGLLKEHTNVVRVQGDATIVLPLLLC